MKLSLILILIFALAACDSADESTPEQQSAPIPTATVAEPTPTQETVSVQSEVVEQPTQEMPTETIPPTDEPAMEEEVTVDRPAWQTIELTDAATGQTFTFADFAGKTVFVEPMATWCPNCRAQLSTVKNVKDQLSADEYVFIGLSVETNLASGDLAAYTDRHGFDWSFAVLSDEALRMLVDEFGRAISNAPSTPHFIIRPDGSYTEVFTGNESSSQLIEQLTSAATGA